MANGLADSTKDNPAPPETPARKATRRPRASAVANRQAILEAALDAFSTYGFEAVSTRAIAVAAGMEHGHLTYYFGSKELIWREVVESFNRDFDQLLEDELGEGLKDAPKVVASRLLPRVLGFFGDNRRLTRLMMQEFSVASSRHDWLVSEFGAPAWAKLRPLFEALAADREKPVDSAALYFSFLGAALLYFGSQAELSAITGREGGQASQQEAFSQFLIGALFAP